ncbi:MAG: O-antigen ligase family protein, partial [Candidatus Omnitrophota bacterium]
MNIRAKIVTWSDRVIYWAIIFIPFVVSFSSAAVNVFIGFLAVGFLVKKIALRDCSLAKTPVNIPFLFLLIIALISFINSISIKASIQGIEKLLKYGLLFLIMASEIKDRKHVKWIIIAVIAGLFLSCSDGFYSLISGKDLFNADPPESIFGLLRIRAAFPSTNILGGYLTLFLALPISLALYYFKGRKKTLLLIVSAYVFYALIFTFSRSAIFGAWAAIIFMAVVKKDKVILFSSLFLIILLSVFSARIVTKLIGNQATVREIILEDERINIYRASLNMIKHHPVIGVGVNTFSINFQKYKLQETKGFTGSTQYYAHNIYLHMAGETGLIGLLVFIWLLFRVFKY